MGDWSATVITCLIIAFLAGASTVVLLVLAIRISIGLEQWRPKTHRGKRIWQPPTGIDKP
jgi:hypothetical protein